MKGHFRKAKESPLNLEFKALVAWMDHETGSE